MASCWICLDDGPDHYGEPPVRDCSCRGDDAGFAHVSCIVEYARRKSIEASNREDNGLIEFVDSWSKCEHCKLMFENQLRIDLLDEFQRFVDEQYPICSWRHLAVQKLLLDNIICGARISTEKREEIIDTTLSIIDQPSIHNEPLLKAAILSRIGDIRSRQEDLTEDEAIKYLGFLEEDRKIRESSGGALRVLGVAKSEDTIARFKARCIERFGAQEAFGELESLEQAIERHRIVYRLMLENFDEVSSLQPGLELAVLLMNTNRTIETWRLIKRLIAISRQYHGREHSFTKMLEKTLARFKCDKIPIVTLRIIGLEFQAIGYEDNKYVLRGPIGVTEEMKETLRVDPTFVMLKSNGAPVVCHGLKNNAAYLNGKVGDIRSFDEITGRYGVFFEDEAIKPKSVKPQNLRILFELPDN